MSLRYSMFKPVMNGVIFHGKFMIYRNGWRSFLYSIKMDMCKFMELRYNALAKLIFGLTDGKTNINHTCPYNNEKYIAMDEIMSTDLSMRLGGIPLGKGQYGFFTRWIWQNATKVETNIFFNVVRD
ncbi:CG33914 [Drosophila busckii]|uniref:CG33914 n=2 Tax=Drosophila busckii TaxID=30019 RepID=A0A0M3QUU9_DROBS|nr:CG33914 [Drosophila busckii]